MDSPEARLKSFSESDSKESGPKEVKDRYPFTIDVTDARGKQWRGDFVAKAPTLADMINIGRLKASYLPQGAIDDPAAAGITEMICHLAVVLVEKPSWWKPLEFHDVAALYAVYEEVTAYERRFRGEPDSNPARVPETDQDRPGDSLDGPPDLGRQVQSAPERSETIVSNRK